MLSRDDGLVFTPQGLRAATHAANLALARVLERALGRPGTRPVAGRLRLPRPSGSAALSLLIMPITPAHGWNLPGHPAVLLLLSDPAGIARPAHQHLMALYNLTMAEARLAVDLLDGQSLAEIARRRERSLSTIRTQLARLMAKTQTHRQSELVSKLARMTS
jgi:DNA-binding CsgD family transcriptional regulator